MTTLHFDNGLLNDLWNINQQEKEAEERNNDQNIWSMNSNLSKINSNSSNSSTNSVDEKRFYYTNDYVYNPVNSLGSNSLGSANSLGSLNNSFNPMSQPFTYAPAPPAPAPAPVQAPTAPVSISSLSSTPSSHSPQHSQVLFSTGASSPVDQISTSPILEDKKPVNTQLYKTELCGSFMRLNYCPYGNKCQFAHGENELKSVSRPANYRSKPCLNWSKYGSCRYGNRCCFRHN